MPSFRCRTHRPACEGRFVVQQLRLGAVRGGPAMPLHLQAQAELSNPTARPLQLEAEWSCRPAPARRRSCDWSGVAALRAKASISRIWMRGCRPMRSSSTTARPRALGDSQVELDGVQLQFGGTAAWLADRRRPARPGRLRLDVCTPVPRTRTLGAAAARAAAADDARRPDRLARAEGAWARACKARAGRPPGARRGPAPATCS